MVWKRILALVAVVVIVLEPAMADCLSCRRASRRATSHASEASCGSHSRGRLFSGRLFSRLRARRAERRAARQEASCGRSGEASCGAAAEATGTSYVEPSQFEGDGEVPPAPVLEDSPIQDVDFGAPPEATDSVAAPGQTAWQPPVPIRVELVTPPTPFDGPAGPVQASKRTFNPFPMGAIVSPF